MSLPLPLTHDEAFRFEEAGWEGELEEESWEGDLEEGG